MSKENILKSLRNVRLKKVSILGNDVNVKLLTLAELEKLQLSKDVDSNVKLISDLFFDIETGEKVFTPEFLKTEISNSMLVDLYKKAIEANSAKDDNIEKN